LAYEMKAIDFRVLWCKLHDVSVDHPFGDDA